MENFRNNFNIFLNYLKYHAYLQTKQNLPLYDVRTNYLLYFYSFYIDFFTLPLHKEAIYQQTVKPRFYIKVTS